MTITCHIDQSPHVSREALHTHLKRLRVKQETYYTTHETRRDLLTGEPLPFKTVAQYLAAEFTDKNSLKRYLKEKPVEGRAWAVEWLRKRKAEKGLVYAPTQTELRTLMCPTMHYYESVGGYNAICAELGYRIRFAGTLEERALPADTTIIVDSREQLPLRFPDTVQTLTAKLSCGDYGLIAGDDKGVYIERKALPDLVGTLSPRTVERMTSDDSNLCRFARELERAKEVGAYLVLLVESDLTTALGFNHLPHMRHTKVRPECVFKQLRDLLHRFDNFQPLFVAGRKECANAVLKLLALGDQVRHVDLQFEHEAKRLTF